MYYFVFDSRLECISSNTIQTGRHIDSLQSVQSHSAVTVNDPEQSANDPTEYGENVTINEALFAEQLNDDISQNIENDITDDITTNCAVFAEESNDNGQNIRDFCCLHPNTNCTVYDASLMIHTFSIRHDLSWTAIENLIKMVNIFIGEDKLPTSIHLFKQKFKKSIQCVPVKHFICHNCGLYLGTLPDIKEQETNACINCGSEIVTDTKFKRNHFVTMPVREHIRNVLERNSNHLTFDFRAPTSQICDVHDSFYFQKLRNDMGNAPIITLTFSTDGAVVFESTKEKSLWPLQFIINEIDLEHRFKRENIFCSGISFGKTPNMEVFMRPLFEEILQINSEGGLSFKMKSGEIKSVKIFPMIFTGDILAKQYVLNKKSFNGYMGCSYCLHGGTLVNNQIRYCNRNNAPLRTNEQTRADMLQAQISGENVNGYRGVSALMAIENFDIVNQVAIDKMHNIEMGVTKRLFNLFLDEKNRRKV